MISQFPETISTESELEEFLTRPDAALISAIRKISSPLLVLGAGGKMGPTLAVLARRAAEEAKHRLEVIAVSRFSDAAARKWLEERGVKVISCDLLEIDCLRSLPDARNLIYLVGLKFGTTNSPAGTWAMNTIVPANVMQRYPRARIVALSTGNVYPFSEATRGGAVEDDPLTPLGEYPNAAVARERIIEFYSVRDRTPTALARLFYAVELRYGVLVDIAGKVFRGEALSLANGYFNFIWQADANSMILRSIELTHCPPFVYNLCRPEVFSVRTVATHFGELFGKTPIFTGRENATTLLGNSRLICARLGPPRTTLEHAMRWIADWIRSGGRDLHKPTHFEVRDGRY